MGTLTDDEKVAIRRHMGFPIFGGSATQDFGHRFMTRYGTLEYRMNHMASAEETVVRGFLTKLAQLETDLYAVRDNMDTSAAAIWTRNADEQSGREQLYRSWALRLCNFFGIQPGPGFNGPQMSIAMVV